MSLQQAELDPVRRPDRSIAVELWLDYDAAARAIPGIAQGRRQLDGDWASAAAQLYQSGIRCVRLVEPVDLDVDPAPLILLRELTSWAIVSEWVARCAEGSATQLMQLSHLYPPSTVLGELDPLQVARLRSWREQYFPCKCTYRVGPGFVEVRDRRFGNLELFTIDEPDRLAAIGRLSDGMPVDELDPAIRQELADVNLITEHDGLCWWLPMRLRRWPFYPMTV
ncbi:MAG: DUF5825 family protein [Jatrophihabitantaceae bacterium]